MEVRPFDGGEATEAELRQTYALFVDRVAQENPGFPVPGFEQYADQARQPANYLGRRCSFAAHAGDRIIGLAAVSFMEHQNSSMCVLTVDVAADHRRHGVGTALVQSAVRAMQDENQQTVLVSSIRRDSAAFAMLSALGFAVVWSYEWNVLHLDEVDPALWDVPTSAGFRLEAWEGSTPEALLVEYAKSRNAIHDAPAPEGAYQEAVWTPERVRMEESEAIERGNALWTVVAVHEATGRVAGQTSILFMRGRTNVCWQRDTSVLPEFRGHGLGRTVKAAMNRRLRAERPEVRLVSTSNAADNPHMIRVNRELGYTLFGAMVNCEADVDELAKRLQAA